MKHKILIVDDHILFNEGVKELLSYKYDIVGQVFDGKDVLKTILNENPEVVLLDINLPSINGFELAKEMKKSFQLVKVILLSMYTEPRFIEQSEQLKVDGYLLKNSTKEELILGIDNVLMGKIYYDPKLKRLRKNLHKDDYFVKQFSITPREIEIIRLISQGLSNKEISERLFLGLETVKTHRKNIYFKLNITKITDLIWFASQNGILG